MGEAQGPGEKRPSSAFGRIVDHLKDHPPLLYGLGAGILILGLLTAKQDYRPLTVPLLVVLVLALVAWLAAEWMRSDSFSLRQGRGGTIRKSRVAQGWARGRRKFTLDGDIVDSDVGNIGPRDSA